jgi:hypothetical protein
MSKDEVLRRLEDVIDACGDATGDDQLFLLELAWMATAAHSRASALAFPGGFTEARASQVARLEKILAIVRADEPDLEMERMWQEGDHEGFAQRLQRKILGESS